MQNCKHWRQYEDYYGIKCKTHTHNIYGHRCRPIAPMWHVIGYKFDIYCTPEYYMYVPIVRIKITGMNKSLDC